jgi:hypothetical protein
MPERDAGNLFGCPDLVGSCVPPSAVRCGAAARLQHGVNELAEAASVQSGIEVDLDDFHRDFGGFRDQGGFAGQPYRDCGRAPGFDRLGSRGSPCGVSRETIVDLGARAVQQVFALGAVRRRIS